MKKLALLMALVVAVPAIAAVNFELYDAGGKLGIRYTTTDGDLPRGVALKVESDAALDMAGETTVNQAFNTYIDYAYSNPMDFEVGDGHPYAKVGEPGALEAGATSFVISMGVLDQDGDETKGEAGPASADPLIIVPVCGNITVSADTLRGPASGVVGDAAIESNLPLTIAISCEDIPCVKETASFYQDWVDLGKPDCWCYPKQCRGDADGKRQGNPITGYAYVSPNDLNILISGWNIKDNAALLAIEDAVCADFDHQRQGNPITGYARVSPNDLNIMIESWNVKDPGVADCPMDDYNFWTSPE